MHPRCHRRSDRKHVLVALDPGAYSRRHRLVMNPNVTRQITPLVAPHSDDSPASPAAPTQASAATGAAYSHPSRGLGAPGASADAVSTPPDLVTPPPGVAGSDDASGRGEDRSG